jgi:LPXTG-motif cell wall-anchored protein
VTATFEDENGDQQVLNTGANGGIVSGSGDNKAYIISPAGWTLIDAEAEVENPDEGAFFNLTHTCPGKPGDSPTTPGEQATTPGGSPSAPGDQTTTAGGLPTTGASIAIVFALGLALAAGGVLIMILRRTRSQDS